MSFKFNHNIPPISLENYEEYLLLYVDGELSHEQMVMVDAFLEQYPHLQAELELLLGTRLSAEEFSFDKEQLLAHNMPVGSTQEDLLFFIDNELSPEKEKEIQFELASNPHYQLQHKLLSAAKLDATEVIPHPNRAELYRRERRVVPFTLWMRIAAAVVVIASAGILLLNSGTKTIDSAGFVAVTKDAQKSKQLVIPKQPETATEQADNSKVEATVIEQPLVASKDKRQKLNVNTEVSTTDVAIQEQEKQPTVAANEAVTASLPVDRPTSIETIQNTINTALPATAAANEKNIVTSESITALNNQTASADTKEAESSNHKGSLKSFFRKATRVIGRTTGISSEEEDDGKVLIGAMAVKLK